VPDLLVVGSGAAGLSAALRAADLGATVTVITGGAPLAGSSPRAQGGVAAALAADDAPDLHAADTVAVGAGLNDRAAVAVLTREGSRSMRHLLDAGVPFDADLGLEAGHGRRRILHAGGAATGQVLTAALLARVEAHPSITLRTHTPARSVLVSDGRVAGVLTSSGALTAAATLLATGGYAALWGRTTNSPETRGTGLVLAYEAGASLADLEFVQFHPTALNVPGQPAFLLSEALRGEGALLVNGAGDAVVDPLLPRDVVARALHRHLLGSGPVFLTLRHLDPAWVHARFENLSSSLAAMGLDLARDLLPVAPAAHYCMGGIRTDTWGRTDVPGLYAAGESACSGAQGANRLASNSLLECLVWGARAAEAAITDIPTAVASWHTTDLPAAVRGNSHEAPHAAGDRHTDRPADRARETPVPHGEFSSPPPWAERSDGAWPNGERLDADLGVEREPHRLANLFAELKQPADLIPALAASSALLRQESRGAHFRTDHPSTKQEWRGRIHWRRAQPPRFEEVLP